MLSIFRRTPKWQSPKADVRIEAIKNLQPDNADDAAILLTLARDDSDATVRQQAVSTLNDLDILSQIHKRDADEKVRQAASLRLQAALTGKTTPALAVQIRLSYLDRLIGDPLLLNIVQEADDIELRLKAISCITHEASLAQIVQEIPLARIRQAAAEGIKNEALLESLVKLMQAKDKNTYRTLKTRLDALTDARKSQQQHQQKLDALCTAMESHAKAALNPLYAAKAESLHQQWQDITKTSSDTVFIERFETAYDTTQAQLKEIHQAEQLAADTAQAANEQKLCLEALEASLQQYQGQEDYSSPALAALKKTQKIRWDYAAQFITPTPAQTLKYEQLIQKLDTLESLLQQWQADRSTIEAMLQSFDAASEEEKSMLLQSIHAKRDEYLAFHLPLPLLLQAVPGLPAAIPVSDASTENKNQHLKTLHELLDKVDADIKAGRSKQAAKQLKKARDFCRDHKISHTRLNSCAEKLRELQSWAGFAIQPKKEALVEQMKALISHEMDLDNKADAIHALQEEWKSLGVSNASIEQPLWEQFKTAADEAFEPCRLHFVAQRELRSQNYEKRKALFDQIQSYFESLPEKPDWKAHEAILKTARHEWQLYHPSDYQHTRALQEKFYALLKALEAPLQQARRDYEKEKRDLIAQAVNLVNEADNKKACDQTKALQQRWKTVGQAAPHIDHKLWLEFRQACDAVFHKREVENQSRQQKRDEQISQASTLIHAVEALLNEEPSTLASKLKEIDDTFRALDLPREQASALRQQFNTASKLVTQKIDAHQSAQQHEKINHSIAAWEALELDTSLDKNEQLSTFNLALLDLEIMLEMPSPEAWQSQRRERQMQQLQSRGLRKASSNDAKTLLADILRTAVPKEAHQDARARLFAILQKCR